MKLIIKTFILLLLSSCVSNYNEYAKRYCDCGTKDIIALSDHMEKHPQKVNPKDYNRIMEEYKTCILKDSLFDKKADGMSVEEEEVFMAEIKQKVRERCPKIARIMNM